MKVITEESFKKFLQSIRKEIPCDIERSKIDWPEAFDVQLIAVQCEVQFPITTIEDINSGQARMLDNETERANS